MSKLRNPRKLFKDGQPIRHRINSIHSEWIGTYNVKDNTIIMNDYEFDGASPLNNFVTSHYAIKTPQRITIADAWNECECYVDNEWVSTFNLPLLDEH